MVQGVGWLQVAKCTQGSIFNSINEAPASSRHDGIITVASPNSRALAVIAELAWLPRTSVPSIHTVPWDIIT